MPKTRPEGFVVVVVQRGWCGAAEGSRAAAGPGSVWGPGAAVKGLGHEGQ